MPTNQTIVINSTDSGQTFTGDNNQYVMAAGTLALGIAGQHNTITGGTGPNAYSINSSAANFNQGNSLTTGTGGSSISLNGDWSQVTVSAPQVVVFNATGNSNQLLTSDGPASGVVLGTGNNVTGGNGTDTFLLVGTGNVATLGAGTDAVGVQGDALVFAGSGTDTFAFLAGSSTTGPTIDNFNPALDRLSILLDTAFSPGLTDSGLSPQAFLNPAFFGEGTAPTSPITRIFYNQATGALDYTPNGSGSTASQQIATLPTGLTLNASNIFISNRYVYGAPVQNPLDSLPAAWGVNDPLPTAYNSSDFGATDQTTGVSSEEPGQIYTGPVSYLKYQFSYTGTHRVSVSANVNNAFIQGAGNEALKALGGNNVLSGGLGSNFLVGGAGTDTFFTDARTSAFVWNTIVNFHPGDMVTLFGFTAGVSSYGLTASEGASGYQGLTVNADIAGNGQVTAKVTLTGLTAADLSHLTFATGVSGGIPYLGIQST
jgi:Ca2+-binding RTX toxin-like protein